MGPAARRGDRPTGRAADAASRAASAARPEHDGPPSVRPGPHPRHAEDDARRAGDPPHLGPLRTRPAAPFRASVHRRPRLSDPSSTLGGGCRRRPQAWPRRSVPIPPSPSTLHQHLDVDDNDVVQYILWLFRPPTTRCSVDGVAANRGSRGPAPQRKPPMRARSEAPERGDTGPSGLREHSAHSAPPTVIAPHGAALVKGSIPWTSPCTPSPSACSAMPPSAH